MNPTGSQIRVLRTLQEECQKDCIVPHARKGASLVVWGCIWGRNRGPLVLLPQKSITSHVYRQKLHKYLLPTLRQTDVTHDDPVIQQDNARIYTSNLTQQFITRYNIDVADHPLYSPNQNEIENDWILLKCQVTEEDPDRCRYPGGVDSV